LTRRSSGGRRLSRVATLRAARARASRAWVDAELCVDGAKLLVDGLHLRAAAESAAALTAAAAALLATRARAESPASPPRGVARRARPASRPIFRPTAVRSNP